MCHVLSCANKDIIIICRQLPIKKNEKYSQNGINSPVVQIYCSELSVEK